MWQELPREATTVSLSLSRNWEIVLFCTSSPTQIQEVRVRLTFNFDRVGWNPLFCVSGRKWQVRWWWKLKEKQNRSACSACSRRHFQSALLFTQLQLLPEKHSCLRPRGLPAPGCVLDWHIGHENRLPKWISRPQISCVLNVSPLCAHNKYYLCLCHSWPFSLPEPGQLNL